MKAFSVINNGMYTLVQDLGRVGFRHVGIPVSGALDKDSLINANRLVGNEDNTPCLEMLQSGLEMIALDDFYIAITGATASITIDMVEVSEKWPVKIRMNQILSIRSVKEGQRSYLAIEGGISAEIIFGSASVHERIMIGRKLKNGDIIKRNEQKEWSRKPLIPIKKEAVFHVMMGPDIKEFNNNAIHTFLRNEYMVSDKLDRMGIRLSGPAIKNVSHTEVLSHPVVAGCIQVPKDGHPIILLSDCQTTGGYPVIACIHKNDISKLGQLKTGDKISFKKS